MDPVKKLTVPDPDQFTGIHGIAIPDTLRDLLYVLEELLGQEASLNPAEIMSDTAGASDVIFGWNTILNAHYRETCIFSRRNLSPVGRYQQLRPPLQRTGHV